MSDVEKVITGLNEKFLKEHHSCIFWFLECQIQCKIQEHIFIFIHLFVFVSE